MHGFVKIVQAELLRAKLQIALLVHPYLDSVAAPQHQKVLTNVKLGVVDEQRTFYELHKKFVNKKTKRHTIPYSHLPKYFWTT